MTEGGLWRSRYGAVRVNTPAIAMPVSAWVRASLADVNMRPWSAAIMGRPTMAS